MCRVVTTTTAEITVIKRRTMKAIKSLRSASSRLRVPDSRLRTKAVARCFRRELPSTVTWSLTPGARSALFPLHVLVCPLPVAERVTLGELGELLLAEDHPRAIVDRELVEAPAQLE